MNLRRKTPSDSLYLLLDTLCNAFGGIILLAVLVVLLTSKEKSQTAASADSSAMLSRRLALAQTNLQQSVQLAASLQAQTGDPRWQQQLGLLSTRKELQEAIQQLRDNNARDSLELETTNAADPAERLKSLRAALATAQTRRLDAQNGLSATQENNQLLNQRVTDLEKQVTARIDESERAVRLPKEHDTDKRVVYIIIEFGHFYPCHNIDLSRNETDIKWVSFLGREVASPIRDQGLDASGLAAYLSELSGNDAYVAYCVFDDSFPAFIRARQMTVDQGISHGWEPFRVQDAAYVMFSGNGYVPKAQ